MSEIDSKSFANGEETAKEFAGTLCGLDEILLLSMLLIIKLA